MKKFYKEGELLIEEKTELTIIYKIIQIGSETMYLEDLAGNYNGNYDIVDVNKYCKSHNNNNNNNKILNNFKKYFLENENNS